MRILYVAMADEYGRPELGPSFEEMNFRGALEPMVDELVAYDFKRRDAEIESRRHERRARRDGGNAEARPRLLLLFENEIQPDTIEAVASAGKAATMNWLADDHCASNRFEALCAVARRVVTTDHDAPARYEATRSQGRDPLAVGLQPSHLKADDRCPAALSYVRRTATRRSAHDDRAPQECRHRRGVLG